MKLCTQPVLMLMTLILSTAPITIFSQRSQKEVLEIHSLEQLETLTQTNNYVVIGIGKPSRAFTLLKSVLHESAPHNAALLAHVNINTVPTILNRYPITGNLVIIHVIDNEMVAQKNFDLLSPNSERMNQ